MRGETCDRPATRAQRHLSRRGGIRDVRERLRGAEVARDLVPRVLVRMTPGQMEYEAPDRADDVDADRQQRVAQAGRLCVAQRGVIGGEL